MNLHRIEGKAEWEGVLPEAHNFWQRLAAGSSGILTIGNFFSIVGLIGVLYGLFLIVHEQRYILGLVILLLGRLCDIADGWLANKTGTKSPLGETIDSGLDKLTVGATLIALVIYGILPSWAFVILTIPHIIISALTIAALQHQTRLHPILIGKLNMGLAWATLPVFVVAHYMHGALQLIALLLFCLAAGSSFATVIAYIQEYRRVVKAKA